MNKIRYILDRAPDEKFSPMYYARLEQRLKASGVSIELPPTIYFLYELENKSTLNSKERFEIGIRKYKIDGMTGLFKVNESTKQRAKNDTGIFGVKLTLEKALSDQDFSENDAKRFKELERILFNPNEEMKYSAEQVNQMVEEKKKLEKKMNTCPLIVVLPEAELDIREFLQAKYSNYGLEKVADLSSVPL